MPLMDQPSRLAVHPVFHGELCAASVAELWDAEGLEAIVIAGFIREFLLREGGAIFVGWHGREPGCLCLATDQALCLVRIEIEHEARRSRPPVANCPHCRVAAEAVEAILRINQVALELIFERPSVHVVVVGFRADTIICGAKLLVVVVLLLSSVLHKILCLRRVASLRWCRRG